MEPWVDAVLVVVLAIAIDRFIGEVPNSVHPLRWMGNILSAIDRRITNRTSFSATVWIFVFPPATLATSLPLISPKSWVSPLTS